VNIAVAGTRALDFRFANGSTGGRSLAISVNGTVVSAGLAFNPTGSWSAWSNASLNAVLPAGIVRVRATATGSSGPNMDSLTIR
jgi:Carbohydrate binding module (family 6)